MADDNVTSRKSLMYHQQEIIKAIKTGMEQACSHMYSFTDEPATAINAEYLFTVSTAQAIDALNGPPASPYQIRIEHDSKQFAKDCFPPVKLGHPMQPGSAKFRPKQVAQDMDRHGRIDIAVYVEPPVARLWSRQPLCAIEVKGFNPTAAPVVLDLQRNLNLLAVEEGESGPNMLQFTAFAALHKQTVAASDEASRLAFEDIIKSKYAAWIDALTHKERFVSSIEVFTISWIPVGTVSEEVRELVMDTSSKHHFVGAIVVFERPKPLSTAYIVPSIAKPSN